jgi:lysophospholipase L1-like esterase
MRTLQERIVRARAHLVVVSACLPWLVVAATASAAEPAPVEVRNARLVTQANGDGALLIPVRYPIQLVGQQVELRVSLLGARGQIVDTWLDHERASAGFQRTPERRRRFVLVHRIDLGPQTTRLASPQSRAHLRRVARRGGDLTVYASAALDINQDGAPELASDDREVQVLRPAGKQMCATPPQALTRPGKQVTTSLPLCGGDVRWRIARRARHGSARIRSGRLTYRSSRRFRGTDHVLLSGRVRGAVSSARGRVKRWVPVKVVRRDGVVVRAIGDSVTAGFGYYDNGAAMPFTSLFSCKPAGTTYNDACSSNSINRSDEDPGVNYAPDYGLSNNISWVAQWANEHGVTNFENLAVTGSEPSNWTEGGQLHATTQRVIAEDPDYILMTMGANPLLSDMLFGADNMGCAVWSDVFGHYRECIEEAFRGVDLRGSLARLYRELVDNTSATIYLMQYHLSVPSSALAYSATQIAMMGMLLNQEIASVAAEVNSDRLRVIAPPHFDVGIDISPVYPATYSCSSFGYRVDGRSVQSTPTQDELEVDHPLSFCSGPAKGPPWVISGDTGIHPSAAGYSQMAAKVPAPD